MNKTTNKVKTKVSEKQDVSKKILPTLREMTLYANEVFPIRRYTVLNSTIQKVQTEEGKKFTFKKDQEKGIINVIRTQ